MTPTMHPPSPRTQDAPYPAGVRPISILLVEDNPGDVRLTQEALKAGKVLNTLRVAGDGLQAMAILRREGPHAQETRPDLVLLDLNLPRMDGQEVLRRVKKDPALAMIPIVVLTSSKAEEDIVKSYNLHANSYITKPVDLDRFMEVVRSVGDYWLNIVRLPPAEDG